ncbi:MAG: porin [Oxalobacteraceae bacterium]|nr:porin [Oxalobacteraceae bacterium]
MSLHPTRADFQNSTQLNIGDGKMKKSLMALACASAFAASANAQSTLTTYGIVDMGFVAESGGTAGSIDKITSGAQSGTRLGFKGTEDLGNNMKALFVLETGVAGDTGGFGATSASNIAFARQAFLGLQSDAGTLTLGRQYTPFFLTLNGVADPFASGLAGNAQNLIPHSGIRMNNAVKYVSPIFSGVSAELAYGFGENSAGIDRNGRNFGGSIGYSDGALNVRLAHHRGHETPTLPTTISNLRDTSTLLAANYKFEVAKVFAAYSDNDVQISGRGKSRDLLIGVSVPFGNHTFIASYITKDGRSALNRDANQLGLGYTYALSKRTNLYAAWASIDNKNGAPYTVGNNSEPGSGDRAFNLGVRHTF